MSARELSSLVSTWYGEELEALARLVRSHVQDQAVQLVFTDGTVRLETGGESVLIYEDGTEGLDPGPDE